MLVPDPTIFNGHRNCPEEDREALAFFFLSRGRPPLPVLGVAHLNEAGEKCPGDGSCLC